MESTEIQHQLRQERAGVLASIDAISEDFDALIASSADSNGDDEQTRRVRPSPSNGRS